MKKLILIYAEAIKKAAEACKAADTNDDGGTCNLDSVVIDFKGWRETAIEELSRLTGIRIGYKLSGIWNNTRFVSFPANGQGNNRTRMVQAAYNSLKNDGLPAFMYYAMD